MTPSEAVRHPVGTRCVPKPQRGVGREEDRLCHDVNIVQCACPTASFPGRSSLARAPPRPPDCRCPTPPSTRGESDWTG